MDNSHPLEVPVIFLKKPEQAPNLNLGGNTQLRHILCIIYVKKMYQPIPGIELPVILNWFKMPCQQDDSLVELKPEAKLKKELLKDFLQFFNSYPLKCFYLTEWNRSPE